MTKNIDNNIKNIVTKVELPDIACTSCASVIERYFNKEKGINVNVNFGTKKAIFNYDAKLWDKNKIQKAMRNLGYNVFNFMDENKILDDEHVHSSEQHDVHIEKAHQKQRSVKRRDLIELIIGWILLLPLFFTMLPLSSAFIFLNNPYFQLTLALPIQFYFGRKFYVGIYRELVQQKWPGMHTLVCIGTTTAFLFSLYLIIINDTEHLFFEVSASIIMIVLLGEFISSIMQKKATNGLESLIALKTKTVLKFDNNTKQETFINIEDIQLQDILVVRKGETVPTDGILISTNALLNEAIITGETQVINKTSNEDVIGGTINVGENFRFRATRIGKDTVLANIIKAVEEVQAQKPILQKIGDKIAGWFTPVIIIIALLVFIIHFFAFQTTFQQALKIAISTLVIACPCALGIATPLAVAVGINKAAKIGIIYNKAAAFEKITKIDTICFDKTGTLTTGNLTITSVFGQEKHLAKAIALERYSTHPVAASFTNYQHIDNVVNAIKISDISEQIGFGIKGKYEKESLEISSLHNLQAKKFPLSPFLKNFENSKFNDKQTILALAINKVITNIFILEDQLQDNAVLTINKIKAAGIKIVLISGDNERQTVLIAKRLGIKDYFANIKPEGKSQIVKNLQAKGEKVAFVGDGVNDIIALEQSDLAIAMGTGSDIAKKTGDITISGNDISSIYKAIILTRKTKNTIWFNFAWAFSYNLVIIPLAAVGLISPMLAAIAMAFSEITVIVNSLVFKYRQYKY